MSYDLKEEIVRHINDEAPLADRTDYVKGREDYEARLRYPIPDCCDREKIQKAIRKLALEPVARIKVSDAALLPLTPMEKGFVLGVLAEYAAKEIK